MKKLSTFILSLALGGALSADVLYWQVGSDTQDSWDYSYAALRVTTAKDGYGSSVSVGDWDSKGSGLIMHPELGEYAKSDYSFYIELIGADGSGVAYSEIWSYDSLTNFRVTTPTPGPAMPWTGGSYHAVPEPTSGLLMLLGLAGLA
ncbi:MAG: hypothetical protein ACI4RA_05155, partial [Kiritimatiellia bacterium]